MGIMAMKIAIGASRFHAAHSTVSFTVPFTLAPPEAPMTTNKNHHNDVVDGRPSTSAGTSPSTSASTADKPAQTSIADARDRLASLVHDVEEGPAVEITRRGRPVAVLVSYHEYQRLLGDG